MANGDTTAAKGGKKVGVLNNYSLQLGDVRFRSSYLILGLINLQLYCYKVSNF